MWHRYWSNAVEIPSETTDLIGKAVAEAKVYVCLGIIEREGGTLYCTSLYFGTDGKILGKHRKLKPTGTERVIWGEGDASTLSVIQTEFGKIASLICWENYMVIFLFFKKYILIYFI